MTDAHSERTKYERMWAVPEYRQFSPGERVYKDFIARSGIGEGDTLIDFGCGTGRAALNIHRETGAKAVLLDFDEGSLDPEVRIALSDEFTFLPTCLWESDRVTLTGLRGRRFGFCTDVMEHLPPERVDAALDCIISRVRCCYFQIYTGPDSYGDVIGETLHLTCQSFDWWRAKLSEYGTILHAEDNGATVIFYVRR